MMWISCSLLRPAQRFWAQRSRRGCCGFWPQCQEGLGILEKGPGGYAPSSLAMEAILNRRSQASWKHLALDERERSAGVHNLALYLQEPGSVWAAQELPE